MSESVHMLRALWGAEPPGLIQVWELHRKRLHQGTACEFADFFHDGRDVYTCVAVAGRRCTTGRPRAADAVAVPGVWADIDIKPGAATDQAHAHRIAHAVLAPTLVVHSGHGLQAWWLLHEPWRFKTRHEQARGATLAARWHAQLTDRAHVRLDPVADLARLMRLPGTMNAKSSPEVPVRILHAGGPRYTTAELWEAAGHPELDVLHVGTHAAQGQAAGDVDVRALPLTPDLRERLVLLLEQSPAFAAAWRHEHTEALGRQHWTASEWDMAVASYAARGEHFTDQDIASLVRAHRLLWHPGDPKADRASYLALTVRKARHRERGHTLNPRIQALRSAA